MLRKIAIFLVLPLFFGCSQQRYINYAELENTCKFPIHLSISDFSSDREKEPVQIVVLPNQKQSIFAYISYGEDLDKIIGDQYFLQASNAKNKIQLTRSDLLSQLKNSPRNRENRSTYSWQISTSSWCAKLSASHGE